MLRSKLAGAAVGLALLTSGASTQAAVLPFAGSMTGLGFTAPDPACAPLPIHGTISPASTSGTSSVGAFTYSHDICFNPLGGPFQGTFAMNFGADSFSGTLAGADSPDAIPGVFDLDWTYTILGGTGRFLDASGTFTGIGTADPRTFPAVIALNFAGSIDAPAVPEPDSWALIMLGFAATGVAMRRARRQMLAQVA